MNATTTANEYETAANDFLSRNGLKFRATLSNSKIAPWDEDGEDRNHYRVTISRHRLPDTMGDESDLDFVRRVGIERAGNGRLVFDFWGSVADAKALPEAEKRLQDMRLQMQNMEPHLRLNWTHSLHARKLAVEALNPSAYDVLACISGDAYTPETFADFCAEYGYETDSIKALQQFRRCDRFAKRLRAFFTEKELTELSEIN